MSGNDKTLDILNLQFTGNENEVKLLIFTIEGEEFGLDVLLVQEIIRFIKPTKIPNMPEYVRGVINFRGEVIPVVDLRERYYRISREYDEFTVVVVIENENKMMGLVVDQVSDIVNISKESIQPTSEISNNSNASYLGGMGRIGKRLILMLDTERLLDLEEHSSPNSSVPSHIKEQTEE